MQKHPWQKFRRRCSRTEKKKDKFTGRDEIKFGTWLGEDRERDKV